MGGSYDVGRGAFVSSGEVGPDYSIRCDLYLLLCLLLS